MRSGIQRKPLLITSTAVFLIWFFAGGLFAVELITNFPVKTVKANKRDGDPVNIALVGSRPEIIDSMIKAGWRKADPLTIRTLSHEVESVIAKSRYASAPVSALYLFGRKQDLAFEQIVGHSPRQRHHVRFWNCANREIGNRELWFGAATFDVKVGLSKINHEITHHIDPDIDAERDKIIADLVAAGKALEIHNLEGIGPTLLGRNGEGDIYFTDGELSVVLLAAENSISTVTPVTFPNTKSSIAKKHFWSFIKKGVAGFFKKQQHQETERVE